MSLWVILAVLQRRETCIFKTKLRLILQSTPKTKCERAPASVTELQPVTLPLPQTSMAWGRPLSGLLLAARWRMRFHTSATPGTREQTDQWHGQSSTINLELFGIANLIPFDVHKFSIWIWRMFTFTPQRTQSYPRHTQKVLSVTHWHLSNRTVRAQSQPNHPHDTSSHTV